jgi:predicted Fe-Mo cluster-binding NifX family protein
MKVALATWNGRISPVFDVARQVLMVDVGEGRVHSRREEVLPGTDLQTQADRLMVLGPQVLICGAISQAMAAILVAKGVEVISFIAGPVEQVLGAWMAGGLPAPAWSMPGCCGRMRQCHGGGSGGRGRGGRRRGGRDGGTNIKPRTANIGLRG